MSLFLCRSFSVFCCFFRFASESISSVLNRSNLCAVYAFSVQVHCGVLSLFCLCVVFVQFVCACSCVFAWGTMFCLSSSFLVVFCVITSRVALVPPLVWLHALQNFALGLCCNCTLWVRLCLRLFRFFFQAVYVSLVVFCAITSCVSFPVSFGGFWALSWVGLVQSVAHSPFCVATLNVNCVCPFGCSRYCVVPSRATTILFVCVFPSLLLQLPLCV